MNRIGEAYVRPHDITIRHEPSNAAVEALVERVVHLGFEVRVDLLLADGIPVHAQLTRDEVEQLELEQGQIVWVAPERERVFAGVEPLDADLDELAS